MWTNIVYVLTVLLLFASCQTREEKELRASLEKAGENRTELEAVLRHYSDDTDPRKLEAARFLIRNMQYHYTRTSPEIGRYYGLMDSICRLTPIRWSVSREQDSLFASLENPFLGSQTKVYDNRTLRSESLIRHIDDAFALYDSSEWCKGVGFDVFCEYLLPYRVADEYPDPDWMTYYRRRVEDRAYVAFRFCKTLQDSLYTILNRMSSAYRTEIVYVARYPYGYRPQQLASLKRGTCLDYNILSCFLFRSVGIPVAMDYTPLWGNRSLGHDWSALFVSPGVTGTDSALDYSFSAAPKPLGSYLRSNPNRPTKIYRTTFSRQAESLAAVHGAEMIPGEFSSGFIRDVSAEYGLEHHVSLTLPPAHRNRKFYYLCSFDNRDWVPVAWTRRQGERITFPDLGGGIVYLPCKYEGGRMQAVSEPFILHTDGRVETLEADTSIRQPVTLYRKYADGENIRRYSRLFGGGRIEASDNAAFRNATVLYCFPDSIAVRYSYIRPEKPQSCRYLRFVAGNSRHGGEVAEFEAFGKDGGRIDGKPVGHGKWEDRHPITAAFDGDVLTYARADSAEGSWIGLDFGGTRQVAEIRILPRNDDNFIRRGEQYRLQYWHRGGWHTLGDRTGDERQYLRFGNCPANALFRLRNLTGGKEERIFVWRNGRQEWW